MMLPKILTNPVEYVILEGECLDFGKITMKGWIKNMLWHKKTAFWVACAVVVVAAVGAVLLMANPAQTLELPDTVSVFTVEMEQFNDRLSVGRSVITDAGQIETILSAMAGAKKHWGVPSTTIRRGTTILL